MPFITANAQKKNSGYQLHIRKSTSPIHIDGELNEQAWKDADVADNFFMVLPMDTSHAKVKTAVRMTYDAQNVYVMAVCYINNPGPYTINE